jgi:hypothetical protein
MNRRRRSRLGGIDEPGLRRGEVRRGQGRRRQRPGDEISGQRLRFAPFRSQTRPNRGRGQPRFQRVNLGLGRRQIGPQAQGQRPEGAQRNQRQNGQGDGEHERHGGSLIGPKPPI